MKTCNERISIGIIVSDEDYSAALAKSLAMYMTGASFGIAKTPEVFMESMDVDVCLIDAVFLGAIAGKAIKVDPKRIVVLYDGDVCEPPRGLASVDMYSGMANIIPAVLLRFAESSDRPIPLTAGGANTDTEIYSFFSTEGGSGTTSVAYATARELSKYRGKRVFFISLEPYETFAFAGQGAMEESGSEKYLYYYLKGDMDILPRIREAVIETDTYGVIRFRLSRMKNRLRELSESTFLHLLEHLSAELRLDAIVVDRGVWAGDSFASQHFIYVIRDGSPKAIMNAEGLAAAVGISNSQFEDLVVVRNMAQDMMPDNEVHEGVVCGTSISGREIYIPHDTSDFQVSIDGIEPSLTNVFGIGVKEIADALLGAYIYNERCCA